MRCRAVPPAAPSRAPAVAPVTRATPIMTHHHHADGRSAWKNSAKILEF
jgi:hypothetical protein